MGFTSLIHACSTASGLAGGCAPSSVIVYGNHSLMPSAWSSLHSPMPAAQLQGLLGAAPPAPLSLTAITCSCLQHGVHFTHPCLQHSFRACWGLRPQPRYHL